MHILEKNRYSLKSLKKITLLIRDVFHFYIISLKKEVIFLQLLNRNYNDTHSANEEKRRDKGDLGEELKTKLIFILSLATF